jgi:hypothetical protein
MKRSEVPTAAGSLALGETTGWPSEWQIDLRKSFAVRWRGRGTSVPGVVTVIDREILWVPTPYWRDLGARAFSVQRGTIDLIETTRFSSRICGLVIHIREDGAVWLLLRSRNVSQLLAGVRALAP